jgi:hypothetical protein
MLYASSCSHVWLDTQSRHSLPIQACILVLPRHFFIYSCLLSLIQAISPHKPWEPYLNSPPWSQPHPQWQSLERGVKGDLDLVPVVLWWGSLVAQGLGPGHLFSRDHLSLLGISSPSGGPSPRDLGFPIQRVLSHDLWDPKCKPTVDQRPLSL